MLSLSESENLSEGLSEERLADTTDLQNASFTPGIFSGDIRNMLGSGRRDLVTIHGTEPYEKVTLEQLAAYFSGTATEADRLGFTSSLIFPHNQEAASIYQKKLSGVDFDEKDDLLLRSHARFPGNSRAASLHFEQESKSRSLNLEERLELYAAEAFPYTPEEATKLVIKLTISLSEFQKENVSESALARELLKFVREEITTPGRIITSKASLAEFFCCPEETVNAILSDSAQGLSPLELRLRKEKQIAASHLFQDSVTVRLIVALRNFVSLENELHKTGAIPSLSSTDTLGKMFGIPEEAVQSHLRFLFLKDYRYRIAHSDTPPALIETDRVLTVASDQIRDYLKTKNSAIESDEELGSRFNLTPVTVYHTLRSGMDKDAFDQRMLLLREAGKLGPHLASVTTFVKQEIHAYLQGEMDTVSDDEYLAKVFQVTPQAIYQKLSPVDNGLSRNEFRIREFALVLQQPQDSPSVALRLHMMDIIKEHILRKTPADLKSEEPANKLSGSLQDKRPIAFMGNWYGSYEEAACATLISKYVPEFTLKEGETFQVSVGDNFIDFKVGSYFLEYHPILLFWNSRNTGSFKSRADYLKYLEIKNALDEQSGRQRNAFVDRVRNELREQYFEERKEIVEQSLTHGGTPLLVVESPKSLYYFLKHIGTNLPGEETFLKEFNRVVSRAKAQNKSRRKDKN